MKPIRSSEVCPFFLDCGALEICSNLSSLFQKSIRDLQVVGYINVILVTSNLDGQYRSDVRSVLSIDPLGGITTCSYRIIDMSWCRDVCCLMHPCVYFVDTKIMQTTPSAQCIQNSCTYTYTSFHAPESTPAGPLCRMPVLTNSI